MLLRTRLCWPPPWLTTPQNEPGGAFHLEWPRIAAFLETEPPPGSSSASRAFPFLPSPALLGRAQGAAVASALCHP